MPELEIVLWDLFHEVEHVAGRITRLEQAIDEAVKRAPVETREVIEALQSLRGVARITAATIVTEVGCLVRFASLYKREKPDRPPHGQPSGHNLQSQNPRFIGP